MCEKMFLASLLNFMICMMCAQGHVLPSATHSVRKEPKLNVTLASPSPQSERLSGWLSGNASSYLNIKTTADLVMGSFVQNNTDAKEYDAKRVGEIQNVKRSPTGDTSATATFNISTGSNNLQAIVDVRHGAGPVAVVPGLADDALRTKGGIKLALKNAGMAAKVKDEVVDTVKNRGKPRPPAAAAHAASLPEAANAVDASPRFDYYASIIEDKLMFNIQPCAKIASSSWYFDFARDSHPRCIYNSLSQFPSMGRNISMAEVCCKFFEAFVLGTDPLRRAMTAVDMSWRSVLDVRSDGRWLPGLLEWHQNHTEPEDFPPDNIHGANILFVGMGLYRLRQNPQTWPTKENFEDMLFDAHVQFFVHLFDRATVTFRRAEESDLDFATEFRDGKVCYVYKRSSTELWTGEKLPADQRMIESCLSISSSGSSMNGATLAFDMDLIIWHRFLYGKLGTLELDLDDKCSSISDQFYCEMYYAYSSLGDYMTMTMQSRAEKLATFAVSRENVFAAVKAWHEGEDSYATFPPARIGDESMRAALAEVRNPARTSQQGTFREQLHGAFAALHARMMPRFALIVRKRSMEKERQPNFEGSFEIEGDGTVIETFPMKVHADPGETVQHLVEASNSTMTRSSFSDMRPDDCAGEICHAECVRNKRAYKNRLNDMDAYTALQRCKDAHAKAARANRPVPDGAAERWKEPLPPTLRERGGKVISGITRTMMRK